MRVSRLARAAAAARAAPTLSVAHGLVTRGLYRTLLHAATAFARSDFGRDRPLERVEHTTVPSSFSSPVKTFTLTLLTHTGTYVGHWPASVWLAMWRLKPRPIAAAAGVTGADSMAARAAAAVEADAATATDAAGRLAMRLTPERARLLVRSAFRARVRETDDAKLRRYTSDAFRVLRLLNTVTRFPPHSASEATTDGCYVGVQSFLLGKRDGLYHYEYRVTIANRTDEPQPQAQADGALRVVPRSFRLETRRWSIVDLHGNEEVVDGPGVVGQHPHLAPGQSHRYRSSCLLRTPLGYMTGHYVFADTSAPASAEDAKAAVPTGSFSPQPGVPPVVAMAGYAAPPTFRARIAPFLLESVTRDEHDSDYSDASDASDAPDASPSEDDGAGDRRRS